MACTFIREVTCDCCGRNITDLFGGYMVKRLGDLNYDICNRCMDEIVIPDLEEAERLTVHKYFVNEEGRSNE